MRGRHLYRYFSERKWAEAFLDGSMLFRSLAYFRDYEDEEVRGDTNEGTAIMRPRGGLQGRNRTQRKDFFLPNAAFESGANTGEILVYCLSKSQDEEKRRRFRAAACVEILDAKAFCRRVQRALPNRASFGGRPGHEKLGQHVQYYKVTEEASLGFEKVSLHIVQGASCRTPNPAEHHSHELRIPSLRDIAFLHDLSVPLSA